MYHKDYKQKASQDSNLAEICIILSGIWRIWRTKKAEHKKVQLSTWSSWVVYDCVHVMSDNVLQKIQLMILLHYTVFKLIWYQSAFKLLSLITSPYLSQIINPITKEKVCEKMNSW